MNTAHLIIFFYYQIIIIIYLFTRINSYKFTLMFLYFHNICSFIP